MKFFNSIDDKFSQRGFIKSFEDNTMVLYERPVLGARYQFTQCISLELKDNGSHIIMSYEKQHNSDWMHNTVGMTIQETKLCVKKLKEIERKLRAANK